MKLHLDYCDSKAARYAVEKWHYSDQLPVGRTVKIGVWENDTFIGAVIFARGASPGLGKRYELQQTELCELCRVALTTHETPVSRILAIAIKLLKRQSPNLRLIVSFADPAQGHVGGIYQAGGWIFTGTSAPMPLYYHNGRWKHTREVSGGAFGGARMIDDYTSLPKKPMPGKYRYLFPLDEKMRQQIMPLKKSYPKSISKNDEQV